MAPFQFDYVSEHEFDRELFIVRDEGISGKRNPCPVTAGYAMKDKASGRLLSKRESPFF